MIEFKRTLKEIKLKFLLFNQTYQIINYDYII